MPREKRKQRAASQTKVIRKQSSEEDRMQKPTPCRGDPGQLDTSISFPSTSGISNPSKSLFSENHNITTIPLTSLPLVVLTQILESLFTSDICSLSCVNKFFSDFISSLYTPSVSLPGPSPPHLTRYVLSLSLRTNVSLLPAIESYHHLQQLNLRKLKHLKLTGKNHIWNKQYLLSDKYKGWLEYLLRSLNNVSILNLEFLTDESKHCIDIVRSLSRFHNLTEVTLHGIGYFNPTASYHMDSDLAQKIITSVLINNRIKILRLKSFQTLNRCIIMESESLQELSVDFGKNFEIGLLYLPQVKIINMETSNCSACFYHAQNGELKKIVAQGCPRLESFNNIDLASLSRVSESGHWLDQLRAFSASKQLAEGQCVLCSQPEDGF